MVLRNELALNGVVAFLDSSDRNQVTDQRFLPTKTIACGRRTLAVACGSLRRVLILADSEKLVLPIVI